MFDENWDLSSHVKQDNKVFTNSRVDVVFSGKRIPHSSSGNGPRVSIVNCLRGVKLYKWWWIKSYQPADFRHLIFWQIIHSDIYFFKSSFILLCLRSLRALYVRSTPIHPNWLCIFSITASYSWNLTPDSSFWALKATILSPTLSLSPRFSS